MNTFCYHKRLIYTVIYGVLSLFVFLPFVAAQVNINNGDPATALEVVIDGKKITEDNPLAIVFDTSKPGTIITKRIGINNTRNTTLKLKKPSLPPGFKLDGKFPEKIEPFANAFFYVKITSDANNKKFVIRLKTTEKITPEVEDVTLIADKNLPAIQKVGAPSGQPGKEVTLRLEGKNFHKLSKIRTVKMGNIKTPVLTFSAESGEIASVKIRVPENLQPGEYQVSFLATGTNFEEWIELAPPRLAGSPTPSEGAMFKIVPVDEPELNLVELEKIQSTNPQPGENAVLKIIGKGLLNITRIDSVKFGDIKVPAAGSTGESDTEILVKTTIPKNIKPGTYNLAVLGYFSGKKKWIMPGSTGGQIAISTPQSSGLFSSWLVTTMAILLPLLVIAGSVVAVKKGVLYKIVGREVVTKVKGKTPTGKVIFQFKANKDIGSQSVQQSAPIEIPFTFTLKPIMDMGKVEIKTTGKLSEPKKAQTKKPASGKKRTSKPDDLSKIEGIGPKITQLLSAYGIKTFSELSEKKADEIEKILDDAGLWIADPDTWPQQAQLAATGQLDKLEALKKELIAGRVAE